MSDTVENLAELAEWRIEEQEREGVTFLTYINSDGLRVSHPVKIESLTNKPAPWFPRVYDPETVKEMTRNKIGVCHE